MTRNLVPSNCDQEIRGMLEQYHVYGAECIINALARAALNETYLDGNVLGRMMEIAYDREIKRGQEV